MNLKRVSLVCLVFLFLLPQLVFADYQDPFFEIVKGNIPGHSFTVIQGLDENVGTTEYVIWAENTAYVFPPAATLMNISSSSVNDVDGGTGAWNVTVFGLDANYVQLTETVTLNGQNPVSTVNQYYRINRLRVGRSGTAGSNAGIVYIGTGATVAGKPTVVYSRITTLQGASSVAVYTVPDGYTAYIKYFHLGTDTTKIIESTLTSRCLDCPDNSWSFDYHDHFDGRTIMHNLPLPFPYHGHTDIKITARNNVGSAFCTVDVFFILVEDGYTLITNPTQNVIIEGSEVDLLSNIPMIWIVFVAIGTIFTAGPKLIKDKTVRNLSFPLGFVAWLVAAYIWAIEYAGTGFFPIIWVHVIPMFLLMAWGLSDLGSSIGEKYE